MPRLFGAFFMETTMKFIFITNDFFLDHEHLKEIEKKDTRPYAMVKVQMNEIEFFLPLRSGITHKHLFQTDKDNKCGVDYSKAIIVNDPKYIDSKQPYIRPNEYRALLGKEYQLKVGMEKYIKDYKKALRKQHIHEYKNLCKFSTLQNYHIELGITSIEDKASAAVLKLVDVYKDSEKKKFFVKGEEQGVKFDDTNQKNN